jgi:hypothetical protein
MELGIALIERGNMTAADCFLLLRCGIGYEGPEN